MAIDTVYVVLCSEGEYSDRDEWIGGVYLTRAEAEQVVLERSAAMRQEQERWNTYCSTRHDVRMAANIKLGRRLHDNSAPDFTEWLEKNPTPQPPDMDSIWLVEVPIGLWGKHEGNSGKA